MKSNKKFSFLLKIFGYLRPYRRSFFAGLIVLVLSSAVLSSLPYFLGEMLNVALKKKSIWGHSVNLIALYIGGILCLQGLFSFARVVFFAKVSENAMADLRHQLYSKIITLPMSFFDKNRTGELVSRITSDIVLLQDLFSTTMAELIRQVITLVIALGFIFYISMPLALFMLSILPFVILLAGLFARTIRRYSRARQDQLAFSNIMVEETLQAIGILKSFTAELNESLKYRKLLDKVVDIGIKSAIYRGLFISFIIIGLFGSIIAMVWKGANMVLKEQILVGDMMKFILFTAFIGGAIGGLANIIAHINKGIGASTRVFELLSEETEIDIENSNREKISLKKEILFNNIDFSYPSRNDIQVLKNFNLLIKPGEKIAFVGHSGAGKSTIIQALLRYYPIQKGEILLDNESITTLNLSSYRANIALVPQEILLFGGTIRENIRYGFFDATEEDIIEAARKANVLEFVEKFPEKLNTKVGERGIQLSGGQKQRVAIARAIIKNPDILILDEATSNLDVHSELLIQEALENLMEERTTIIIAHRLVTIRKVDMIYVLQNGGIVESGKHADLIQIPEGIYKHLVKLQLS